MILHKKRPSNTIIGVQFLIKNDDINFFCIKSFIFFAQKNKTFTIYYSIRWQKNGGRDERNK